MNHVTQPLRYATRHTCSTPRIDALRRAHVDTLTFNQTTYACLLITCSNTLVTYHQYFPLLLSVSCMLCVSVIVLITQPSAPLDILFMHAVGHAALPLYTSRHCLRSTINYTHNQVVVQPLFATKEESRYMKSNMCMNMYMHVCIVNI